MLLDGTNNGFQHFAAMSLDDDLAAKVNLKNYDQVEDLYEDVKEMCAWISCHFIYSPFLLSDKKLHFLAQKVTLMSGFKFENLASSGISFRHGGHQSAQ